MDRLLRLISCLLVTFGLAVLTGSPAAAAEKKETRPVLDPPPPARPLAVSVARGQRIEIPLRIYGVQNEPLRYLIKSPALHGRLSEPRATSREASAVTYEPPTDLAVSADRFTYSVQNHAGVSAPVEVTIAITDLAAKLAVPASIEFGELLAGDTAVREIEVSNRGGGLIEGSVEVDPPLRIEGRSKYRLEAGDYTYFKIVFAPSEGGVFRREIRYTSDREYITSVSGSAQAPVSAEPRRLELRADANSALRTGTFEIVNRTADDRAFRLRGGARLQVPAEVQVPAHGRTPVAVSTRAEDVAALDDAEVRVESSGFALVIPVQGAIVGPILRLPQPSVSFGRVDAMRGAQASVEIENIGGTTAKVAAEVSAPFLLPETSFELRPGERKLVRLSVLPGEAQRYRTWLKLQGGPTSAEIEVEAELVSGSPTAGRSSRTDDVLKPAGPATPAELPPWMPDLNLARSIRVTAVTATTAHVEWPAELNGAASFRIERLMLTRDSSKELRNAWVEIPKTTFARRDPLWIASLVGLEPNQSQTIQVVPLGPEGQPRGALFRLDFYTSARASIPRPQLLPSLIISLLALGAFLLFRRVRRHYTEPISGF